MTRDRVRCIDCREPISSDSRLCPHCQTLQPSPLLDAGMVVAGIFALLFGIILVVMTLGTSRLFGFALVMLGLGLTAGGYTRYIDREAVRHAR